MIHIDRDSIDDNGTPIRPNDTWFNLARAATETAIAEQDKHAFDEDIYKHTEVRKALERLFHDKCAYCEWKPTGGSDWDVEHFRPKGRVADRKDHTGYYWLAYTWSNLYMSCTHCNQNRKDKARWADAAELSVAGKLDQFPIGDESTRLMLPDGVDALLAEDTLLIDPCNDQPEEYLGYDPTGQIFSLNDNPYGIGTIRVFHLKRRRLRELRRVRVKHIITILKFVHKYKQEGNELIANDFRSLLDDFKSDLSDFAAVARYIIDRPENFNVA